MTAVKESSTRSANKRVTADMCPVTYTMDRIGGYWKPIILYHLLTGEKRYSELRKAIPAITEKMLIQNLKQLEADNLVIREAKPVVPPYVIYSLTTAGKKLHPVLFAMASWAFEDTGLQKTYADKAMEDFPHQS